MDCGHLVGWCVDVGHVDRCHVGPGYVDGQHWGIDRMLDDDPANATMTFKATLLPYEGDESWVEDTLRDIKKLLVDGKCPPHAEGCEQKIFLDEVAEALSS